MAWVPPEEDEEGTGYLRGVVLGDRWHVNLPLEFMDGNFTLMNIDTGAMVPYQIVPVTAHNDTVPCASQRYGIGAGGKRYGMFEVPLGLKRDLCLIARNIPALGYKTYRFIPEVSAEPLPEETQITVEYEILSMQNEYCRITVDGETGNLSSLYDKEVQRELLDSTCPHPFNSLVVRIPNQKEEYVLENRKVTKVLKGPICKSIELTGYVHAHPVINQTITLYTGAKSLYFDTRVLKDSTPLLDVHIAFPFALANPQFRYEGVLSVMNPIIDYLPGSYSDTIVVQNWVKIQDEDFNILWSSLDAPVVGFGELAPGCFSPAYRCVVDESVGHFLERWKT
jgi:hypothetical protein